MNNFNKLKAGTLTKEEAKEQLNELGVEVPAKGEKQLEEIEDEASL
jgi:hypothetical protein